MERKNMLDRFLVGVDLPGETLLKIPLVEILGEHRVLVENHQGVAGYSSCEVCVKVKFGIIKISGQELTLSKMSGEQLVVSGCIDCVQVYMR